MAKLNTNKLMSIFLSNVTCLPAEQYLISETKLKCSECKLKWKFYDLFYLLGTIEPEIVGEKEQLKKYKSLSIIVPVSCAVIVLIAVSLAVFFLVCRKRNTRLTSQYEGKLIPKKYSYYIKIVFLTNIFRLHLLQIYKVRVSKQTAPAENESVYNEDCTQTRNTNAIKWCISIMF